MTRRSPLLTGLAFTAPWLVGSAIFLFLPMAMSLWYSFTDYPILKEPVYIGLDNYAELAGDARLHAVAINTALFAVVAIPLSTVLSLALAAMVSTRSMRLAGFYKAAIFIPTLVPIMASAMIWLWLFNGQFGLINRALGALGLPEKFWPNWLASDNLALPVMVICSLWSVGQQVVIYAAAMQEVPRELYEAGGLDGMGPLRRFWHVTLPMISPVMLFNVVTLLIGTLQVFALPYVLFRDERGQRPAGDFYTLMLYDNAFVYQRMGYASAMAWVQMAVILVLTGVLFWASKRLVHERS